jgi:TIR domain
MGLGDGGRGKARCWRCDLSRRVCEMTSAFISYSWDSDAHKAWVRDLATRLRTSGIEVALDQWHLVPGDQLPQFMESAVQNSDFVLVICTPRYKVRSDNRTGGVGYEGDIMTAEVVTTRNPRKFIPILRSGAWTEAAASWLAGKYYVDLSANPYSESQFDDLLTTLHRTRPQAPPVSASRTRRTPATSTRSPTDIAFEPLRITGVVIDEVGTPRGDGTRGSALYVVPFQLSRQPPLGWSDIFVACWDHPPRFTSMHRPGIASVQGYRIILDGTTVQEVEGYHRETLILAVNEANREFAERDTHTGRERGKQGVRRTGGKTPPR